MKTFYHETAAQMLTRVNPKDGFTYLWIPPGKVMMGCSPGDDNCTEDEKPAREVTIADGFWLGQTPVTQAAFERVMGRNPSYFKGTQLPVEGVTWADAANYCKAVGGRLPTEAEWEYAARGGTTGARYGELDDIAWHRSNSGGKTHEVMQKAPNKDGLYDMLGNVAEWTADWHKKDRYGSQYGSTRGRCWAYFPGSLRVSALDGLEPDTRSGGTGFRCVYELPEDVLLRLSPELPN
jgi:formylglycine-generating enzyme required for sulfatase activity